MIANMMEWFQRVFIDQFDFWLVFGLGAQAMFMMRFLVQWIASERIGRSIIPIAFWFFSVSGGVMLLIYGVVKEEPIIILGQSLGLTIYMRNLWLIFKEKRRTAMPPARPIEREPLDS